MGSQGLGTARWRHPCSRELVVEVLNMLKMSMTDLRAPRYHPRVVRSPWPWVSWEPIAALEASVLKLPSSYALGSAHNQFDQGINRPNRATNAPINSFRFRRERFR